MRSKRFTIYLLFAILVLADDDSIRMFESSRNKGANWLGIADEHKNSWGEHPKLVEHINRTCKFYSQNKYGLICRIMPQEEIAKP